MPAKKALLIGDVRNADVILTMQKKNVLLADLRAMIKQSLLRAALAAVMFSAMQRKNVPLAGLHPFVPRN